MNIQLAAGPRKISTFFSLVDVGVNMRSIHQDINASSIEWHNAKIDAYAK